MTSKEMEKIYYKRYSPYDEFDQEVADAILDGDLIYDDENDFLICPYMNTEYILKRI